MRPIKGAHHALSMEWRKFERLAIKSRSLDRVICVPGGATTSARLGGTRVCYRIFDEPLQRLFSAAFNREGGITLHASWGM
jgi:hypothetical protein